MPVIPNERTKICVSVVDEEKTTGRCDYFHPSTKTHLLKLHMRSAVSRSHAQRSLACTGTLEVPWALGDCQQHVEAKTNKQKTEMWHGRWEGVYERYWVLLYSYHILHTHKAAMFICAIDVRCLTMMDSSPMTTGPLKVFLERNMMMRLVLNEYKRTCWLSF